MSDISVSFVEKCLDGAYKLNLEGLLSEGPVLVIPSLSPVKICGNFQRQLISDKSTTLVLTESQKRHYFHVRTGQGKTYVLAERLLRFEGSANFRDLGGYETEDARRIEWGCLYRSGHLSELTQRDLLYMESLDIRCVCDFRRLKECQREPNLFPQMFEPQVINLDIDPGSFLGFFERFQNNTLRPDDMVDMMCSINAELVREHSNSYRKMFDMLLENKRGASLLLCTAGKDRTGYGVALLLSALGVPERTIMNDYLLTNTCFPLKSEAERMCQKYKLTRPKELLMPILEVRPDYLQAAFAQIRKDFASITDFLDQVMGLNEEKLFLLRARYLSEA